MAEKGRKGSVNCLAASGATGELAMAVAIERSHVPFDARRHGAMGIRGGIIGGMSTALLQLLPISKTYEA